MIIGNKAIYSLLIDKENNQFSLFPNSFLMHKEVNLKTSQKQLTIVVKEYLLKIDDCIFQIQLTNHSREDIKLSSRFFIDKFNE